jgi:type IV pilus assembly protein PilM
MPNIFTSLKDSLGSGHVSTGLDIGSSCLKLVKLRFLKETLELLDYAAYPLTAEVTLELKNLAQVHHLRQVNISLSGQGTVTRCVPFPRMELAELKQSLRFEAKEIIPFTLDQVYLDASILKTGLAENKMLVLVAAAKKDLVNQRLRMLQDLKLEVGLIDLDGLSISNAFLFNYAQEPEVAKTFALLNIGALSTNLSIVDENVVGLNRDIHIGGINFTRKIQESLELDFSQAEEEKLNPRPESALKVAGVLESVIAELASEIRTSFDFYESQNATVVGRIFLSGGGSKLNGIKETLANTLGIEVCSWDPFRKIIFSEGLTQDKLRPQLADFAVAVGLALRG